MTNSYKRPDLAPKLPDVCVRCATCMAACPVSRVTPRFPGPKEAGPGAQRFRSLSEPSVDDWIDLCSGCRLCDTACPAGVPISEMNLRAKAKYFNERGRTLRDWLLVRSDRFGELAARFSNIVNPLLKNATFRRFLDVLLKIDRRRDIPGYEYPTFRLWFQNRPAPEEGRRKVAYFHGCFTNTNETAVGKAIVEVLEAYGLTVIIPPQNCCGMPRLGVGDLTGAREMGLKNIALLGPTAQEGIDILFSSPSCGLMLRHEYERILNLPGAEKLAERLFDICEYLMRLHEEEKASLSLRPLSMKAAYFAPCHLRAMNIGLPALDLMRLMPGLDVRFIEADCCGLGGLYGFKNEKFSIAEEIGKDLRDVIDRIKPDVILTDCEGCRMQIRRLTGLRVVHPVQLLRSALSQSLECRDG